MEALIKTDGAGTSYRGIVVKQSAYGIFLLDNALAIYDWSSSQPRSTGIHLNDGNWHYIAFSFQSGVSNGTTIYLDGQPRLTTTMSISSQGNRLSAGAGNNPGTTQFFNGTIDEIKISNVVRSADYIRNIYQSLKSAHPELGLP